MVSKHAWIGEKQEGLDILGSIELGFCFRFQKRKRRVCVLRWILMSLFQVVLSGLECGLIVLVLFYRFFIYFISFFEVFYRRGLHDSSL